MEEVDGKHLAVILRTALLVEGKLLGPPTPRDSEPKLGTPFCSRKTFEPVSKRSPFTFETRRQIQRSVGCLSRTAKCNDSNAHPACCIVLARFFVCKTRNSDSSCATVCISLVASTRVSFFLQLRRQTKARLDLCQFGHTTRRPTQILLANVDPCDVEKLHSICQGSKFTCSHSSSAHRQTTDPVPCRLSAEFCHSLVQSLMARHTPFFRTAIPHL